MFDGSDAGLAAFGDLAPDINMARRIIADQDNRKPGRPSGQPHHLLHGRGRTSENIPSERLAVDERRHLSAPGGYKGVLFFFEKKDQKTFASWSAGVQAPLPEHQSFLLRFLKKEDLSFFHKLTP
jgi:hypothetical protein